MGLEGDTGSGGWGAGMRKGEGLGRVWGCCGVHTRIGHSHNGALCKCCKRLQTHWLCNERRLGPSEAD